MESKENGSGNQTGDGHLHKDSNRTQFVKILGMMYNQKFLCDVMLVAEGREVAAHKLILASCSPYFYKKFSENSENAALDRIEIENISHETLSAVITYLYKSQILITEGNVGDILAAAHMFDLQDLRDACQDSKLV